MLQKLIAGSMILALLVGAMIMQFTTPAAIHPIGLLVFFICIYIFVLGTITLLMAAGQRLAARWPRWRHGSLTLWRIYQLASVLALAPVMLLAIHTVGSVTVLDVVFVATFVMVAVFYVYRRG